MTKISKLLIGLLLVTLASFPALAQTSSTAPGKTTPSPSPTPEEIIEEDDTVLKSEADLVNILFTASDKDRRFVTNLTKDDIKIFEDGKQQEIFTFSRQVDLPLSLAIVIDTSRSQERTLPEEKRAAMSFIEDVVRANKDEVAILSFNGETTLEQGLTGNLGRLRRATERVEFIPPAGYVGGGVTVGSTPPISARDSMLTAGTAVWDAIWVTSDEVLRDAPQGTRRAIILLTDGDDTASSKRLADAVDRALKSEAVIYCIGIGDPFITTRFPKGVDESSLRKIAERTGGRAFFPDTEEELQKAFSQIQTEMRSQYLLAYEPTNVKKDGTYRQIRIEVSNAALEKQKIKLNYRQGYFAQNETAPKK